MNAHRPLHPFVLATAAKERRSTLHLLALQLATTLLGAMLLTTSLLA